MKRSALVFAAALAASVTGGFAQANDTPPCFSAPEKYQNADLGRLEVAYLYSLGSDNNGVVESAIAQVAWMQMARPDVQVNGLKAALGCLSVNGRTPSIRFKAYLAGLVIDDPSMFALEGEGEYGTDGELFSALSGRLQKALIGQNSTYVRPE